MKFLKENVWLIGAAAAAVFLIFTPSGKKIVETVKALIK